MERFRHPLEQQRGIESVQERLIVCEGPRGAFAGERERASEDGVERVDPLAAGAGPAISSVSTLNKESRDYTVCLGLAAAGRSVSGERLSFVSHHVPTMNPDFMAAHERALRERLDELAARTDGRIDAVCFGGEYEPHSAGDERAMSRNAWYAAMREMIGRVLREAGIEMRMADRPNLPGEHADMFLDTTLGTLYIERYR